MFSMALFFFKVTPNPDNMDLASEITVTWMLRYSRCMEEYMTINEPVSTASDMVLLHKRT